MMKNLFSLLICSLACFLASAQSDPEVKEFQSSPEAVLEEVFRAAAKKDYSNLHKLCPADKSNDRDTQQYICDVGTAPKSIQKEFRNYFKKAHITGETIYRTSRDEMELARTPFWFNHPAGESRSDETMKLVKQDGKWYLVSF